MEANGSIGLISDPELGAQIVSYFTQDLRLGRPSLPPALAAFAPGDTEDMPERDMRNLPEPKSVACRVRGSGAMRCDSGCGRGRSVGARTLGGPS